MKSAAFNLAFKVHRNEMPFPEGLMKAVEAEAEEDFIEALNSLAGETKYDAGKLKELVEEAQRGVVPDQPPPSKSNTEVLREEIENLRANRAQFQESIKTLEIQIGALNTSVVPGLNSLILFVAGGTISIILLLIGVAIFAFITAAITLVCSFYFYLQDSAAYTKQVKDINRKKERAQEEMQRINLELGQLNAVIKAKRLQLQALENPGAAIDNPPRPIDASIPPIIDPNS